VKRPAGLPHSSLMPLGGLPHGSGRRQLGGGRRLNTPLPIVATTRAVACGKLSGRCGRRRVYTRAGAGSGAGIQGRGEAEAEVTHGRAGRCPIARRWPPPSLREGCLTMRSTFLATTTTWRLGTLRDRARSNVGRAKICARSSIPTPPQGYWRYAKLGERHPDRASDPPKKPAPRRDRVARPGGRQMFPHRHV
jgi:hypothetical protein